jgi:hypothetical protein
MVQAETQDLQLSFRLTLRTTRPLFVITASQRDSHISKTFTAADTTRSQLHAPVEATAEGAKNIGHTLTLVGPLTLADGILHPAAAIPEIAKDI